MRETLCDLWSYSVVNNEFRCLSQGQKLVCEPRKDHSMAIVGMHLVIHGGINSRGLLLEDVITYNFCKFNP